MAEIIPEADIFTLKYKSDLLTPNLIEHQIKESKLGGLPGNPWRYIEKFQHEINKFNLNAYNLVLCNTSGPMRWLKKEKGGSYLQIAYIHEPYPFIHLDWETLSASKALGHFFSRFSKDDHQFFRNEDLEFAKGIDVAITNSVRMKNILDKLYGIHSHVVYPSVSEHQFYFHPGNEQEYYLAEDYFDRGRGIKTIIDSFNYIKDRVIILEHDANITELQENARENISFVTSYSETHKARLLRNAKAVIIPQTGHFSILALEALNMGIPVICHKNSTAAELVTEEFNGTVYDTDNPDGLLPAIFRFEKWKLNRKKIADENDTFTRDGFRKKIKKLLATALSETGL